MSDQDALVARYRVARNLANQANARVEKQHQKWQAALVQKSDAVRIEYDALVALDQYLDSLGEPGA